MSDVVPFRRATGRASQGRPEFERAVALALNDAGFGEIQSDHMTAEIRAEITSRRDAVIARLRPATWEERCAVLASMQNMPGPTEVDPELRKAFARQDADDLEGAPALALTIAARAFRRQEGGEKRPFRPSVGELLQKALKIAAPDARELQRLDKALAAKVLPPPSKTADLDRRREMAQKLRADFLASLGEVSLEPALVAEVPFARGARARSLSEEAAKACPYAVPTELAEQLQHDAAERKRVLACARQDEAITALELHDVASTVRTSPEELAAVYSESPAPLSAFALRAIGLDCDGKNPAASDSASSDAETSRDDPD